ncbi:carboxypeptidase-like regulatory domain-containing protein [Catenovulum adriaticum]|uniref:Carboxypeptidase-like regulatory domain-containing protein n=1 Tax=Catenovulum adriaticum TaxID=2984846 RepID=A0ABY7APZ4_9ALTE|nr:carboxypeptidase-like regulatory domain-containing protein [Catenovulum sp. TS8]WAJ70812.1 carboxypeptidase-like regulatory domain-containing protein [Catenovulum sp. TS8]
MFAAGCFFDLAAQEPPATTAQTQAQIEQVQINNSGIPTGEPLLLLIKLGNLQLADVFAIKSEKGALIGLQNLADVLDFAIEVSLNNKTASGWYINEAQTFSLNLNLLNQQIQSGDNLYTISADNYQIDDDIYIELAELEKWFKLELDIDYRNLELDISSAQTLPIEQRLARKNKLTRSSHRVPSEASLPWRETSYQLFSSPVLDAQIFYSNRSTGNTSTTASVVGAHDLAYLSSRYFIRANEQTNRSANISDVRLNLFEESTDKNLLGPLQASRYEFGDVQPINIGYNSITSVSRGINFSNRPLFREINNETTSFSGDIQPGWDVELYRNKILLESSLSNDNGRYEFNNVELLYGDNQFELIFYGPQGQVKTESKQIIVNQNPVEDNQFVYQLSLTQQGRQLFDEVLDKNYRDGGWLLSGRYDYGFSDWASFYVGHGLYLGADDNIDVNNTTDNQYAIGGQFNLFDRAILSTSFDGSENGDRNLRSALRTKFGDQAVTLNYQSRHVSEGSNNQVFSASVGGNLYSYDRVHLRHQNNLSINDSGNTQTQRFNNSLALYTPWLNLNNQISWQHNANSEFETDTSYGQLQLQKRFYRLSTRFSALYSLKPVNEITAYRAEFSYPLSNTFSAELDLYQLNTTDYQSVQTNLTWSQDNFRLSSYFDYDSEDKWRLGLSSNFSFGYHAQENIYFLNKISLTRGGSVLVRVFEDENLNGQYDIGEKPLEGVKVAALQGGRRSNTNELGLALLRSLSSGRTTDITIDKSTLPDPFSIPSHKGISITPRDGYVDMLDVPIVMSSEIEGTVFMASSDQPATYVPIQLLNKENEVIASTDSEFDGYYLFVDIPPGEYQIKVADHYLKQKQLKPHQAQLIEFSGEGKIVNGMDIHLEKYQAKTIYAVIGPSFDSLPILNLYWQQLKLKASELIDATYKLNSTTSRYTLVFAQLNNQQASLNYCKKISSILSIDCSVSELELLE